MNELSATGFAYVAGLFDGEGYIRFSYKRKDRPKEKVGQFHTEFYVTVTNKNKPVLLYLKEVFGGSIFASWVEKNHVYFWKLTRGPAFPFLRHIRPYLKIKREQADLVLKNQRLISNFAAGRRGRTPEEKERLTALDRKIRAYTKRGGTRLGDIGK
jgi:hypothetical protein